MNRRPGHLHLTAGRSRGIGAAIAASPAGGGWGGRRPPAGRVGIVTGGSRGIGAAIAASLAEDGAAVVVSGRDAERLARAAEESRAQGGGAPAGVPAAG